MLTISARPPLTLGLLLIEVYYFIVGGIFTLLGLSTWAFAGFGEPVNLSDYVFTVPLVFTPIPIAILFFIGVFLRKQWAVAVGVFSAFFLPLAIILFFIPMQDVMFIGLSIGSIMGFFSFAIVYYLLFNQRAKNYFLI